MILMMIVDDINRGSLKKNGLVLYETRVGVMLRIKYSK